MRHKTSSIVGWREEKRPHAGSINGIAALDAIVCSGELRKVQSLVDERAVNQKLDLVKSSAKLSNGHVHIVASAA